MLARENRLTKADEFKSVMKAGRKVATDHLIIYLKRDEAKPYARFGFVVAKSVGGAVKRNLVKRRLRELARTQLAHQFEVVVRALPGSAELEWNKLREEFLTAISVAEKKAA